MTALPLQPASEDIWDKKYRLKKKDGTPVDQTVDDTYRRVAKALSDVEDKPKRAEWYERFLWALRQGAIPAGRITSNAGGQEYKPETSLINCTVSGTITDSMDDILAKVHEAGMTLKGGSGIGYEHSTLRPKGAYVAGAGSNTSGPLSFMDIYDKMCFTVASAGGRRGAQMGTFDVQHPDVVEFIRAKREDGRLRQFNLSLLITDGFMQAVENDGDWPLVFPVHRKEQHEVNLDNPEEVIWREWPDHTNLVVRHDGLVACKIYKKIKAKRLWDIIMSSTYDFAEPGFILIDKVNEMNNNWFAENIRATNPCVTGDTLVLTRAGEVAIRDVVGQHVEVWNGEAFSWVEPRVTGHNQDVVRFTFSNGKTLTTTLYHGFFVGEQGAKVEAKDLDVGMALTAFRLPSDVQDQRLTVVAREFLKEPVDTVYCFTEQLRHAGTFNGIVTRNCGEQPLPPYGSCWTGDMRIQTNLGLIRTEDAYRRAQAGEELLIAVDERFTNRGTQMRPARIVQNGVRDVFEVRLANGQRIELTADHRVHTVDGWKEVQALQLHDEVSVQNAALVERPLMDAFELGMLAYLVEGHQGARLEVTHAGRRHLLRALCDRLCINYTEAPQSNGGITLGLSNEHDAILEVRGFDWEQATDAHWAGYAYAAQESAALFKGQLAVYTDGDKADRLAKAWTRVSGRETQKIHHGKNAYRVVLHGDRIPAQVAPARSVAIRPALAGWILTDGWLTESSGLLFNTQDDVAREQIGAEFARLTGTHGQMRVAYRGQSTDVHSLACYSRSGLDSLRRELGLVGSCRSKDIRVPDPIFRGSVEDQASFLGAVFGADGGISGEKLAISLTSASREFLEDVQIMLLGFGIHTRIASGLSKGNVFYTLLVKQSEAYRFYRHIGFPFNSGKQAKLERLLRDKERWHAKTRDHASKVVGLRPIGQQVVYDMEEATTHTLVVNGLVVHNCLLGSVNLTRFVKDAFTPKASFDWDEYRQVVAVFTRMLDNVVELNGLPLAKQRHEIETKRRHGMGFLGLGSTLTMLRIPYGSAESVKFTEDVTREMALVGWEQALELAKEKGPAPILAETFNITAEMLRQRPELVADGYKEGDTIRGSILHAKYSRYMQKIATVRPELVQELAEIGARFTHHSSIAPTGTISLSLANNASNGIEPSFAHHYSRNVIREGRKAKEKVEVYSYELLAYRELVNPDALPFSTDPATQLPAYFIAADQVTPTQHVDIQAAAQLWIDSSISKTANVPTDYPYEDFKDIYLYAYKQGLKGCTTFRFNPAAFQGVLVKEADLENTTYRFTLDDGTVIEAKGNEQIEYDGETNSAANLYDALKEGYYGKF